MCYGHQSWAEKANETAVKMAHEILRTLIIVHGGAIIAMFGFIGSVLGGGKLPEGSARILAEPLIYLCWGIVLTIGAMVGAYFTDGLVVSHTFQQQIVDAMPGNKKASDRLRRIFATKILVHVVATILTLGSIGSFILGMYDLRAAIGTAFQPFDGHQVQPKATFHVKSKVADR